MKGRWVFQQNQQSKCQLRYTNVLFCNAEWPQQFAYLALYIHIPSPTCLPEADGRYIGLRMDVLAPRRAAYYSIAFAVTSAATMTASMS